MPLGGLVSSRHDFRSQAERRGRADPVRLSRGPRTCHPPPRSGCARPGNTGVTSRRHLVGCADLDAASADRTIQTVCDRFAASKKSFGWITSPSSRPGDIPRRLTEAGLVKADELAGMALTDLSLPIRANPEVEVRPAGVDEQRHAISMTANAYGMPLDVAEWFTEALIGAANLRSTMYHAFLPGRSDPVAFGNLVFVPDTSIVLLGGAA